MHVDMENALSGIFPAINHNPEPFAYSQVAGKF
jgi:hypothetical protein